jgi:hypothetical protein
MITKKGMTRPIQFDMAPEHVTYRVLRDEGGHPPGAGEIGRRIGDQQAAGQEEVPGEEEASVAIVVRQLES